jgi:hypothetical protein
VIIANDHSTSVNAFIEHYARRMLPRLPAWKSALSHDDSGHAAQVFTVS